MARLMSGKLECRLKLKLGQAQPRKGALACPGKLKPRLKLKLGQAQSRQGSSKFMLRLGQAPDLPGLGQPRSAQP